MTNDRPRSVGKSDRELTQVLNEHAKFVAGQYEIGCTSYAAKTEKLFTAVIVLFSAMGYSISQIEFKSVPAVWFWLIISIGIIAMVMLCAAFWYACLCMQIRALPTVNVTTLEEKLKDGSIHNLTTTKAMEQFSLNIICSINESFKVDAEYYSYGMKLNKYVRWSAVTVAAFLCFCLGASKLFS